MVIMFKNEYDIVEMCVVCCFVSEVFDFIMLYVVVGVMIVEFDCFCYEFMFNE